MTILTPPPSNRPSLSPTFFCNWQSLSSSLFSSYLECLKGIFDSPNLLIKTLSVFFFSTEIFTISFKWKNLLICLENVWGFYFGHSMLIFFFLSANVMDQIFQIHRITNKKKNPKIIVFIKKNLSLKSNKKTQKAMNISLINSSIKLFFPGWYAKRRTHVVE